MFRRRRSEGADPDRGPGDDTWTEADDDGAAPEQAEGGTGGTEDGSAGGEGHGPYDAEAPADGVPRLDLGGLQVAVPAGLELRLEVTEGPEQAIQAVTLAGPQAALQLSAFAAPRSEGIWSEVREEIAASLREAGGSAEEVAGDHGPELAARIPTPTPGELAPARFLGVEGPRWFLRGVLTGAAAFDPEAAAPLREALRLVVVVRGEEAMTVREQLPLRLSREALADSEADDAPARPDLDPFHRGPEITETY